VLSDVCAPRDADDPFARNVEHEIVQARRGDRELAISEIGEAVREYLSWFHSYCERAVVKAGSKERNDDRVFDWPPTQRFPLTAFVSQPA
jgi:hypothetical protein